MNFLNKIICIAIFATVSNSSMASSGESSENKKNLTYTVNAGFGFAYGKLISSVEFGYFLQPDIILNLNFMDLKTTSTEHDNDQDKDITYDSGGGNALEVTIKKFVGNSQYFRAGLYYRNQTISERDIDDGGFLQFERDIDADGVIQDMGGLIAVGHQWQWSSFTLGCDWVGYSSSLGRWKYENDGEGQTVSLNNLRLLNFYLGASF
jgi:hypothetical protein